MQYEGKICVITGAASGIGRALAAELCGRGATVVLSDIDGSAADAAATQLRATGAHAESAEVDVTDAGAVATVVENAVEKHGRLDLIFNNAGIAVEVNDELILRSSSAVRPSPSPSPSPSPTPSPSPSPIRIQLV